MKNRFLKTILPALLLVGAIFIIGTGCGDDLAPQQYNFWPDADQDSFGDASVNGVLYTINGAPDDYVRNNTDCDDTNVSINTNATEVANNLVDEDCNGRMTFTLYVDADGDGFGDADKTEDIELDSFENNAPNGYSWVAGDCNDDDADINPKADEVLGNGIDDNCDGNTDFFEIYADNDGDGYGAGPALAPPANGVHNNFDCDDNNAEINPYVREIQDGLDNDCDNDIDEIF